MMVCFPNLSVVPDDIPIGLQSAKNKQLVEETPVVVVFVICHLRLYSLAPMLFVKNRRSQA